MQQITSSGTPIGSPEDVFVGNTATKPNLALTSTATASSVYDNRYPSVNVNDGDLTTVWISKGELNPWIKLDWNSSQTINKITLYDRSNLTDWAPGGTLTFSDGSSVPVTGILNNGTGLDVTFANKNVTWVKFQVSGGSGTNVGFPELQVFNSGSPTPIPTPLYQQIIGQCGALTAMAMTTVQMDLMQPYMEMPHTTQLIKRKVLLHLA